MTEQERMEIAKKSAELLLAGKEEESTAVFKQIPLPPSTARIWKKYVGLESLKASGWNLSEAEAAFGKDWLDK
ncbi:MAG: hypothetical protein Pg6C_07900 [Treponemataceae bacterium]|nr:MAG: hypothetical protein Pg6C_07900 [Treponemataceae bacterium]